MPTTPNWEAANNGFSGNLNATNHASQMDQLLGTHFIRGIYSGSNLVAPVGGFGTGPYFPGNKVDLAQKFTMPAGKTTVGRIVLPVTGTGAGADLLVSLVGNNAGVPDTSTVYARTKVPASWINNLTSPTGLANGGPLASTQNYGIVGESGFTYYPWASLAVDNSGSPLFYQAVTCSGDFFISAGGLTASPTAAVITAEFLGENQMAPPSLRPSLPQGSYYGMLAATTDSLVYAGGNPGGSSLLATVYTASWNSITGEIGAWSSQTPLPLAIQNGNAVASGNTVYVLGGTDASNNIRREVNFATVSNGQIAAWTAAPPLPIGLQQMASGVINGWLVVVGGSTTGLPNTASNTVFYAKILSDGSLSTWQTGPSLPVAGWASAPGWNVIVTPDSINFIGANLTGGGNTSITQSLSVGVNGPANFWKTQTGLSGATLMAGFPLSDGQYNSFSLSIVSSYYYTSKLVPLPLLSIPLFSNTLTGGSSYFVMLQSVQNTSSSDYLNFVLESSALPDDVLTRYRYTNPWSDFSGFSIPMYVYDNTAGGNLIHTWEDPSAGDASYSSGFASRISSYIYDGYNNIVGLADSTLLPNDPMNSNPTFTSGVSGWTPTGCTFTQSSAQVHGGFPFSGLLTPSGTSTNPKVVADQVQVPTSLPLLGTREYYQILCWVYSPNGWSNLSIGLDWFDRNHNPVSSITFPHTIPAATWTYIITTIGPPSNIYYASIDISMVGTPSATDTMYFSNVTMTQTFELTPTLSSVSELSYNNGVWPATSVTQLA